MNKDRFFSIVDAYGAEPRRWPDADREGALAFAEVEAEAGAHLRRAAEIDRVLDENRPLAPSPAMRRRILNAAPTAARDAGRINWWAPSAGLVAAGVAGLMFGATLLAPREMPSERLLAELEAGYDTLEALDPGTEGQL